MKIEKIKPIPKYILALIRKADKKRNPEPIGTTRYFAYLTKNDGELVKVTVAVRHRYKKWYCKQCAVHGIRSEICFLKNMAFFYVCGYVTSWYAEGFTKYPKGYDDGAWGWHYDRFFDPYAPVVNPEYALKFPEYKYSRIEHYRGAKILQYLRLYKKFPQIEYLMKFGLECIVLKKTILQKTSKDKKFRKWLIRHRSEIGYGCYAETVLTAYRKNKSIAETQAWLKRKKHIAHGYGLDHVRELFKGNLERLLLYLDRQGIDENTYSDYIRACIYLKVDLSDTKNLLPLDFMRWHDERIAQMRILQEEEHRKFMERQKREREQLERDIQNCERNFSRIVKKYLSLQTKAQNGFIVIIARSPADLIREGQAMSHCVGGENYRLKMSKGKSLIFFVRRAEEPDKAFVTMEYSPTSKSILQCHGSHNTTPDPSVLDFVNNVWLPFANETVNKMKKRKAA